MGSSTNKTTSSTGSSSKAVQGAVDKLAGGLSSLYSPGGSSYVAPSSATTGGWAASLGAAENPAFSGGIAGALQSYGNRAAGNEIGQNDPGYATLRAKLADDTLTDVNSMFTTSGRFGSGSHVGTAAEGLGNALAGLDYRQYSDSLSRQAEAANMLPQIFAAGQLPSSIQQSVGASMDADAKARESGKWDYLSRATGALTGTAQTAGTTTTTSQPTAPLWSQLLGLGLAAL
jgi:hypothetical protein